MDMMYELIKELFDVVVIKKQPSNGVIHIEPFILLWQKKIDINDIFGGYMNTKEFFLQDLVDNMKPIEYIGDQYIESYELPHKKKKKIDDIRQDIESIITKPYDYFKYSELDGSNDRFMNKQHNTSHLNNIINNSSVIINNDDEVKKDNKQYTLFDL